MNSNKNRIIKEFQDFQKNAETSGIKVSMIEGDITHWKGLIDGPSDTVYEGGIFQIDIVLPAEYPYKPPKMKFDTKIWHPNISSQTGAICLDILRNEWSPALSIRTALLSLQALMCVAVPDDPQDAVVASQYKVNKPEFDNTARQWTKQHASPTIREDKLKKLLEMGFDRQQCEQALQNNLWDENLALNSLLG